MGKFEQVRESAVRTGRAALVALPLLLGASTSALAGGPEWVAVNEIDGVQIFELRDNGRVVQPETLAARLDVVAAPTPVQIMDNHEGVLSFDVPRQLASAPVGPMAPQPIYLYSDDNGITFAP